MADEEKIDNIRVLLDDDNISEKTISVYLEIAKNKVLNRLYPYGIPEGVDDVPDRYISNEIQIAAYLINKQGGEGETAHSENGVSRTYESADIPSEYLDDIIQVPKVVGIE